MTDRRRPLTARTASGAHDRIDELERQLVDLTARLRASTLPDPLEFRRVSPSDADGRFGVQVVDTISGETIASF